MHFVLLNLLNFLNLRDSLFKSSRNFKIFSWVEIFFFCFAWSTDLLLSEYSQKLFDLLEFRVSFILLHKLLARIWSRKKETTNPQTRTARFCPKAREISGFCGGFSIREVLVRALKQVFVRSLWKRRCRKNTKRCYRRTIWNRNFKFVIQLKRRWWMDGFRSKYIFKIFKNFTHFAWPRCGFCYCLFFDVCLNLCYHKNLVRESARLVMSYLLLVTQKLAPISAGILPKTKNHRFHALFTFCWKLKTRKFVYVKDCPKTYQIRSFASLKKGNFGLF